VRGIRKAQGAEASRWPRHTGTPKKQASLTGLMHGREKPKEKARNFSNRH